MIKLFSAEEFRDFIENPSPETWEGNGDIILSPSSCTITANLSGEWTLNLTHPYDEYGRYSYIEKGCVIAVSARVAREQRDETQFFRIFKVRPKTQSVEAIAKPVAMEAIYEVPINKIDTKDEIPAYKIIEKLNEFYPNKYKVVLDNSYYNYNSTAAVYMLNTNLQEAINGNQDAAFLNLFGGELVYDNYVYRIFDEIGNGEYEAPSIQMIYGVNLKGIDISESTSDMVTRVYPTSSEGYTLGEGEELLDGEDYFYNDAHVDTNEETLKEYPFAYAKSINYSDVKLADVQSDSDKKSDYPKTVTQQATEEAMGFITAKVEEFSKKYLDKAHNGDWDHRKGSSKRWWYGTKGADGKASHYASNQYIFSYEYGEWYWFNEDGYWYDGSVIDESMLEQLNKYYWHELPARHWYGTKNSDGTAKNYPKSQYFYLTEGHKWIEFDSSGWYSDGSEIPLDILEYLNNYEWRTDEHGTYYGDGEGHYLTDAWVEISQSEHRWVGSDGYLDPQYDDNSMWNWYDEGRPRQWFGDDEGHYMANAWVENIDGFHFWVDENGYWREEYDDLNRWFWYDDKDAYTYINPHDPTRPYEERLDRLHLPYGYLFYSYTDAIGVLTQKVLDNYILDETEYKYFAEAIRNGFKWCETTEIAAWDWRSVAIYDDIQYDHLKGYTWHEDSTGWWYGENLEFYLKTGWVEEKKNIHYWIGADGYWDTQYDDYNEWDWHCDENGWWYGSMNVDGTVKNFPHDQYMYDTVNNNWYWFNSDGYLVEPIMQKWWYGTKDHSDYIFFKYHKVGNYIYWFDADGYIDPDLAYMEKYEWRSDDTGDYYGDGKGHWLRSCWIEESNSKHYWVNEDGYRDEDKDDSDLWKWHGNWTDGWWYGSDPDEEEDELKKECQKIYNYIHPSSETATVESMANNIINYLDDIDYEAGGYLDHINTIAINYEDYADADAFKAAVQSVLDETGYEFDDDDNTNTETLVEKNTRNALTRINTVIQKDGYSKNTIATKCIEICEDYNRVESVVTNIKNVCLNASNYSREQLVSIIDGYIQSSGYNVDEEEDTPSGDDEAKDPTGAKNYAHGQYLYVSENNSWYWFKSDGYVTATWMIDGDKWEWVKDNTGWYYGDSKGNYPAGQWMKIDGKWYFFDAVGYADESTDDFEDSKTGETNTATYDPNREGIGSTSSTVNEDEEETKYDETREGVRAWIQDGFIKELKEVIKDAHLGLLAKMRSQLIDRAEADLSYMDHPKVTMEFDFVELYGTQNYDKYSFLRNNYLGDYVYICDEKHGVFSIERITEMTYDCILNDVNAVTIGQPVDYFIESLAGIHTSGTIIEYTPEDGLEDGYGNYLTTGYNTKLSVK